MPARPTRFLSIDIGSSRVRTALSSLDGGLSRVVVAPTPPANPAPGLVEFDALGVAQAMLRCAAETLEGAGAVSGVGMAVQRASSVVWDQTTGVPVAPGIGWQDLRTVFDCLTLQGQDLWLAPNMSATKLAAILDATDPERSDERLLAGTLDSYLAWVLTGGPDGGRHVTDGTNAAVSGLVRAGDTGDWDRWDERTLSILSIREDHLPLVVDSFGPIAAARALNGAPMLCGILGDQQASLLGQGCTRRGAAKATFGTGGALDLLSDGPSPKAPRASASGTFPIVAWRRGGRSTFATEAIMLSAGSSIDWLVNDMGLLDTARDSARIAASCDSSQGCWFVPALMGLGTPVFDFGARGTLLGVSAGIGRPEIVRAVLEGIAERGADLLDAAIADTGLEVPHLGVDGGMSENEVFVQALADACQRPIHVSSEREATIVGAGLAAALGSGAIDDPAEIADRIAPGRVVEPKVDAEVRSARRERWLEMRARAERTIPELSGITF